MENMLDPRELYKEESDFWVTEVENKRQIKEDTNCHNHGGLLAVSQVCSNPVDPFLEEARATPRLCINRMTVLSAESERCQLFPM